jgi:hypothetical protein
LAVWDWPMVVVEEVVVVAPAPAPVVEADMVGEMG